MVRRDRGILDSEKEDLSSQSSMTMTSGGERLRTDPKGWTVARVGKWLAKIRLIQLKPRFFEAAVHGALLLHLNADEFGSELGIENELHRIKLRKQLAKVNTLAEQFQVIFFKFFVAILFVR